MKATRVLLCHNFKSQGVFTDGFEPTALTCCSSGSRVFLATKPCQVLVYTAEQPPLTLVHRFQTISNVNAIVYSDVGGFVATIESKESRNSSSTARLYFNWRKCEDGKAASVVVAGYSSAEKAQEHYSQFFVVQLPIRYSVTCLGCCPYTGNVVVASEARISIFRLKKVQEDSVNFPGSTGVDQYCDVEHVLDVEPRFPVRQVALCECYLAFMSSLEVRVIHLLFNGDSKMYRSKWSEQTAEDQREVVDEDFVCCAFDQFATLEAAFGTSDETNEEMLVTLPSIAKEIPYLDNTGTPMQVFGPVEEVPGQPLNVRLEGLYSIGIPVDGVLPEVTAKTMLYRRFESEKLSNVGTDEDEIHTLQLLPIFAQDLDSTLPTQGNLLIDKPDPTLHLVSMCCFISGPKEGFLFDVFRETKILSSYSYSTDTVSVFMSKTFLYAITEQGMEVYTSRTYAAAAKWSKVIFEHKLSDEILQARHRQQRKISENESTPSSARQSPETVEEHEVHSRGSPDEGKAEFIPQDSSDMTEESTGEKVRQRLYNLTGKRIFKRDSEKKHAPTKYFVPVYPVEQLLQPCPSPASEDILIGMKSFIGLSYVKCFSNFVLVLSLQDPVSRNRSSSTLNRLEIMSDWTLYILTNENMFNIHKNLMTLATQVSSCSSETYHLLLCEAYMQLSTQIVVETPEKEKTKALNLLHDCIVKFVEYYSSSDHCGTESLAYYKASGLSLEHIINKIHDQQAKREAVSVGSGLVQYLDYILFTEEKKEIPMSQETANKILRIYGSTNTAKVSKLILKSNLQGYSYELAISILQDIKTHYKLNSEDFLASALACLHICDPDHAKSNLAALPEGKLVSVCTKHSDLLHEDGRDFAPLGELLRRHQPRVLLAILLHLHDYKKMSLHTALTLLGAFKSDIENNVHLRDFLEHILSSEDRKESFDTAVRLLCKIYLLGLNDTRPPKPRPLPKLPHEHIQKYAGHFTERFRWLNKLPPFSSGITPPERCPYLQRSAPSKTTHHPLKSYPGGIMMTSSGRPTDKSVVSTLCSCCCCNSRIIRLQSLLCSELATPSLCEFVLTQLEELAFIGSNSIQLLCLPKIGQHHKAIELLLDSHPTLILLFAKSFFKQDHKKWSNLLHALLDRLRDEEQDFQHDNFLKATHGALKHLASCCSPAEFLQHLPSEGSLGFFLPYLEQCYCKWHAKSLASAATTL